MSEQTAFKISPMSSKQLAAWYNIGYRTFLKWLDPIRDELGAQTGYLWNIKQIKIIIKHFDQPE